MEGNPVKVNKFRIEIDGIEQWAVQEIERPEIGLEATPHGGGDHDIKTAGRRTTGNGTIKYLHPIESKSLFGYIWLMLAAKALPTIAKKNLVVKELAPDGIITVNTEIWVGCFPTKDSCSAMVKLSSDNVIESLELSVDDVIRA